MKPFITILYLLACSYGMAQANRKLALQNAVTYRFSFTLREPALHASAGIYDAGGALVRTLWYNRQYTRGTHSEGWDGTDDTGRIVPDPTSCTWQVTTHKLTYTWEGVIGNTSKTFTGAAIHKGLNYTTALCFSGRYMYAGQAYNESVTRTSKSDISNIQERTLIDNTGHAPDITACATDDNYVYWAGTDAYAKVAAGSTMNNAASFVYATRIDNDTLVSFLHGTPYKEVYGHSYSAIGLLTADAGCAIGGIAVQKNGAYLYITRPYKNLVSVYNKTTGVFVTSFPVTAPAGIRISPSGNELWLTHDNTVTEKYGISSNGRLTSTGIQIKSGAEVLAMDVNTSALLLCEGGSNQYIKAYHPVTGAYLWTYGKAGGYLTNATVANDKFYWKDLRNIYSPFIAFAPDGSFWVGDNGNCRMQHYSADRKFLNRISWTPIGYAMAVDPNNPSRVFFLNMEYKVDYNKPLAPDNGSWQLVKNWGGDMAGKEYSIYTGIKEPVTFSNGSTFCYLGNNADSKGLTFQLVRLNSDGTKTRTSLINSILLYIDKSGDLYRQDRAFAGQTAKWYRTPLAGYDKNGYPQWGTPFTLASIVQAAGDPGFQGDVNHYRPNASTADGVFIAYDNTVAGTGYHLGGVKNGRWLWKTELSTYKTYSGDFPPPYRFETGNGVRNAGTLALTLGNTIITGYNGEFYKGQGQTNMYNHIYSNGLPLAQFGTVPDIARSANPAGFAGNALSMAVVPAGKDVAYLYHNDESIHGGIHRWKITGLNSIVTLSGSLSAGLAAKPVTGNGINLLEGLELTKGSSISRNGAGWTFTNLASQSWASDSVWKVATQRFSLDKTNPDLSFVFRNARIIADTATRILTNKLPDRVNSWELNMVINFQGNNPNNTSTQFFQDIVDASGKKIVRIYPTMLYTGARRFVMYANGVEIFSVPAAEAASYLYTAQPLIIRASGPQLSVSYAGAAAVVVPVSDNGAVLLRPAKLRCIFNQAVIGNHYSLGLGILSANFYTNR